MKNTEFLSSKIADAINRASDLGLFLYASGAIIGLLAILVAISFLGSSSATLLFDVIKDVMIAIVVWLFVWLLLFLTSRRKLRLQVLRNWQLEIFFASERVDALGEQDIRRLCSLIDSVEDLAKRRNWLRIDTSFYEKSEEEFTGMLKPPTSKK